MQWRPLAFILLGLVVAVPFSLDGCSSSSNGGSGNGGSANDAGTEGGSGSGSGPDGGSSSGVGSSGDAGSGPANSGGSDGSAESSTGASGSSSGGDGGTTACTFTLSGGLTGSGTCTTLEESGGGTDSLTINGTDPASDALQVQLGLFDGTSFTTGAYSTTSTSNAEYKVTLYQGGNGTGNEWLVLDTGSGAAQGSLTMNVTGFGSSGTGGLKSFHGNCTATLVAANGANTQPAVTLTATF